MKKFLLPVFLVFCMNVCYAQEINFQLGKSISKFKYKDSQDNELQNIQSVDNFFMTLEYRQAILKNVFKENLFTDLGLGYNRYGSSASDVTLDNYYAWDLTYLGINLGLDYAFYRPGKFTFYGKFTLSPEFLLRGTQTINNQIYDLQGEDDFNTPITFFRGGLGAQYQASDQATLYLQYMGGKSFGFRNDPEELNIIAHQIGFGLLIKLSNGPSKPSVHTNTSDADVDKLEKKLDEYAIRVEGLERQVQKNQQLETEIETVNTQMSMLKDTLSSTLFYFNGEGLNVHEREGKVYVTMGNDMLFSPGSWELNDEGVKAVEALGKGLNLNPDVTILIEGHTDNQPYKGGGNIKDNWDLSIKRATAIVEILKKNPEINPENLTAAGRGEHKPIASNDTPEGRAKNRRIEVIITPNLEKASKLLED